MYTRLVFAIPGFIVVYEVAVNPFSKSLQTRSFRNEAASLESSDLWPGEQSSKDWQTQSVSLAQKYVVAISFLGSNLTLGIFINFSEAA